MTDNETLNDIYKKYSAMVYAKCRNILGHEQDALECLQETFIKVQLHMGEFRMAESQVAWLYRVTTNACLNFLRTSKRKRHKNWEQLSDTIASPDDGLQTRILFNKVIDRLDSKQREVFIYCYQDGMTQEEICEVTGKSRSTVCRILASMEPILKELKHEAA